MWILKFVLVLVNTHSIYGKDIDSNIIVKFRRDLRNSNLSSNLFNYKLSYSDTTPTVPLYKPTNHNNFFQSTPRNNVNSVNGYRYYNKSALNPYNHSSDYSDVYIYEKTTPTNFNNYVSSSTYKYNNVNYSNNNTNYNNIDMNTSYNSNGYNTYRYNMSTTASTYNHFSEYNGNYIYENNGYYNPYNGTVYNKYRYYNMTPSNFFPGYIINGTAVYQSANITIPKHNTTGFSYNNGYQIPSYTTPRYENLNTPHTYNYQDPNQDNFRGFFQQNISTTPSYGNRTPGSVFVTAVTPTPVTATTDTEEGVTVISCILCNIGCPANYSRKGIHCVPDDYEYE